MVWKSLAPRPRSASTTFWSALRLLLDKADNVLHSGCDHQAPACELKPEVAKHAHAPEGAGVARRRQVLAARLRGRAEVAEPSPQGLGLRQPPRGFPLRLHRLARGKTHLPRAGHCNGLLAICEEGRVHVAHDMGELAINLGLLELNGRGLGDLDVVLQVAREDGPGCLRRQGSRRLLRCPLPRLLRCLLSLFLLFLFELGALLGGLLRGLGSFLGFAFLRGRLPGDEVLLGSLRGLGELQKPLDLLLPERHGGLQLLRAAHLGPRVGGVNAEPGHGEGLREAGARHCEALALQPVAERLNGDRVTSQRSIKSSISALGVMRRSIIFAHRRLQPRAKDDAQGKHAPRESEVVLPVIVTGQLLAGESAPGLLGRAQGLLEIRPDSLGLVAATGTKLIPLGLCIELGLLHGGAIAVGIRECAAACAGAGGSPTGTFLLGTSTHVALASPARLRRGCADDLTGALAQQITEEFIVEVRHVGAQILANCFEILFERPR
eukprot:9501232-Pyramimonas_sp.AAC.2